MKIMPGHEDELPVKSLKSLLQQTLGNEIEIESTNWEYLTQPGENFGSLILAVDVTISQCTKSNLFHFVTKLPPPSAYLLELFASSFTFIKELSFYRDLTPEFLQLQRENGIIDPESSWLGPKYYGGRIGLNDTNQFDEQACIVLENLKSSGFIMIDRIVGLNQSQAEFAVKQLAKLHALGIVMKKTRPKKFQDIVLPALGRIQNETTMQCLGDMLKKALQDLGKIPEAELYMNSIKKTLENAENMTTLASDDETWCTFVHNDFWVNNMMFKFNTNNDIEDMKIVDFQLCTLDYGMKDLIFFLLSSIHNDIMEDIFDDMINLYYDSFITVLKQGNVCTKEFTKEKFLQLVEFCAPLKLGQCLFMTQVVKSLPDTALSVANIDSKETFLKIGIGKAYNDKLLLLLNFFRKKNWLVKN